VLRVFSGERLARMKSEKILRETTEEETHKSDKWKTP
jgi:hypothetical protein